MSPWGGGMAVSSNTKQVSSRWRRFLPLALAAAAAIATWLVFEFVVWNKIPSGFVGKWVVEGGPQDGATFDFFRNGTMFGRINFQGQERIVHAKVRIDGDVLYSTTTNPNTREPETRKQTIQSLTDDTLILQDPRGGKLRLVRAE